MPNRCRFVVPAAVWLSASLIAVVQASAAAASGDCRVKKVAFVASDTTQALTTTSYVDVVDGAVSFHQGGKRPGCIIVRADIQATQGSEFRIRAIIGRVIMFPGEATFSNQGTGVSTRSFTWEVSDLVPRDYTVQIEAANTGNTLAVDLFARVITIQHQ